jgi:hypothetical protein
LGVCHQAAIRKAKKRCHSFFNAAIRLLRLLISNHEGRFSLHKEKQGILIFLRELRVLRGWNKINIFQEKCKTKVLKALGRSSPFLYKGRIR